MAPRGSLENLGGTCYMNAACQMFANTPALRALVAGHEVCATNANLHSFFEVGVGMGVWGRWREKGGRWGEGGGKCEGEVVGDT